MLSETSLLFIWVSLCVTVGASLSLVNTNDDYTHYTKPLLISCNLFYHIKILTSVRLAKIQKWTSWEEQLCGTAVCHLVMKCLTSGLLCKSLIYSCVPEQIYIYIYTGLFEIIVRVLTTCHIQYTWDSSKCVFLFNRTTLQVFVTYLTGALYVHPLWFYKHQHDNRVRSKLYVACQRW